MRKILFVIAFLLVATMSKAQEKYFYITLDVNKPLTNTTWINAVSSRGARIGYRAFITPRFSAGLDVSWNVYNQYHPTETVTYSTGALTTDYFKYLYGYSIAASGQYYFNKEDNGRFYPYAGLGLGARNHEYVKFYNIYKDRETSWGFLARPEAGILVKFGGRRSIGAMAAVHYDYSNNKSKMFGYKNFMNAGFQVGIIFLE